MVDRRAASARLAASLPLFGWRVGLVLAGAILGIVISQLPLPGVVIPPAWFLPLHTAAEIFAVVVAALVVFTGLASQESRLRARSMWLSSAFLAVGLFDLLHLLSYAGMPDFITPNSPHKAIVFWLAARLVASFGLLAYVLMQSREPGAPGRSVVFVAAALAVVVVVAGVQFLQPRWIPLFYESGKGLTTVKVVAEWASVILLVVAMAIVLRRGRRAVQLSFDLFASMLLMAVGGLFFTRYTSVTDIANFLGHGFKVASYIFLYRAVFAAEVRRPVSALRRAERARARSEAQLSFRLRHDELTGLPNRTALAETLGSELRVRGSTGALLLVDLDLFQNVNGSFGHDYGDRLLCAVARRLIEAFPPPAFVGRFSGDEFIVLLRGADEAAATDAARRLVAAFEQPFRVDHHELSQPASVGFALYSQHGKSVAELVSHADLALNQAKLNGRRNFHEYDAAMGAGIRRRQSLHDRLRRAMERGEFRMEYQPQVDLASGRVAGWEALIRWDSPGEGAISPAEFIPVAEETGLIEPIGEWTLREACRQLARWQAAGFAPGTMAVNLSPRQFRRADIARRIADILAECGVDARQLELEITETAMMEDVATAAKVCGELDALGVGLAVDDFGTGYSSLAYLRGFPLDKLKIDRTFVRGIADSDNDAAIARTIIVLGHTLGLRVLAEGVETEGQLAYLTRQRCDEIQGYLFSRPLRPEACEALLRERRQLVRGDVLRPDEGSGQSVVDVLRPRTRPA